MMLTNHRVAIPLAEIGADRAEAMLDAARRAVSAGPAYPGIWARMMDALHFSRQCDARRLMHRFQHLIADTESRPDQHR